MNKSIPVELSPKVNQKIFNFEKVFRESSSQAEVYTDAIQNNVSTLFQGINSTVITYGAPSSGKTFTLQGTKAMPGVIPRALHDIFVYITKARAAYDRNKDFKVEISYVELLQNNQFRNVLKEPISTYMRSRTPSCHPDNGSETDYSTWTAAAKRVPVNSTDEAIAIIEDAIKALKRRNGKGDEAFNRSDSGTQLEKSTFFNKCVFHSKTGVT
jgi:Cdc6-like AAA superfamily ATPase